MNTTPRRGLRAAITAVAVAAVAVIGFAAPASAAPLVDPNAVGSITVHKFETPSTPTGLPNNGTAVDTTGLTPLAGVTFSIKQVTSIDLSSNAGWADASTLSGAFDASDPEGSITGAGETLGTASSQTTTAAGTAAFTGLPVGLYLVQETSYPSGVTPSLPFLVSVPLTDPDNTNAWIYDVNVYPKNAVTAATKTAEDASAIELGDDVVWTITADIPNVDPIDGYKIVDPLDSKLTYVSTAVTLSNGTALAAGDYTITHDAATNTVTVQFTASGLTKLAANPTASVVAKITTTVNTVGEIENTALLYPNEASFNIQPGQPGGPTETPGVETKWGGLTVKKTDPNGTALTGATFQVFTSAADAKAQTNPVTIGGQTSFTVTNANGELTLSGLRYSDFANGASVAAGDAGFIQYYLVETKAPSGFELLAQPIEFTVTAATSAVGVDLTVKNVPSNAGFTLPVTGGTGTGLLYLFGFALIAGGAVLLIVRRKAQKATSHQA